MRCVPAATMRAQNFFDTMMGAVSLRSFLLERGGPMVVQIANLMRLWDF
jgi:hypothetical protein